MMRRVAAGGVSVIASYDQSRTFRNTADALAFYALMERNPQIEVLFVYGRFDRSAVGEFSYTTLAAAHAFERRMNAQKISDVRRYQIAQGRMVGKVPAGYTRLSDGSAIIDPEPAKLIRRIFKLYARDTTSVREVASLMNKQGAQLPSRRGDREVVR